MVSINGNLGLPRKITLGNSNNKTTNNESTSTTNSSSSSTSSSTQKEPLKQETASVNSDTLLANRGINILPT